jgi:hypothetical protein
MSSDPSFYDELKNSFPKMCSSIYGGVWIGEGWKPIVRALCANIQNHIDTTNRWRAQYRPELEQIEQVTVEQIKEKFGGLRFYYSGGDEYINGLVEMAESWADNTCETCGKPGEVRDNFGWMITLCDEHHQERLDSKNGRT